MDQLTLVGEKLKELSAIVVAFENDLSKLVNLQNELLGIVKHLRGVEGIDRENVEKLKIILEILENNLRQTKVEYWRLREIGRLLETFGARLKFIVWDAKYRGIEIENYEAEAVLTLLEELKTFALKRIEAEKEIVKRISVPPRKPVERSRRRIRRNDKPQYEWDGSVDNMEKIIEEHVSERGWEF